MPKEIKNRRFVIVELSDDFIQCRGIYTNFARAVGEAYLLADEAANEDITNRGKVSEMSNLEMDTGVMFTVEFSDWKKDYYVLEYEDDGEIQ